MILSLSEGLDNLKLVDDPLLQCMYLAGGGSALGMAFLETRSCLCRLHQFIFQSSLRPGLSPEREFTAFSHDIDE